MVARLADPAWRQAEVVDEWDGGDAWGDVPAIAFGFEGSLEAANRDAAVRFVAKSASRLALVPIEDVLGLSEQPNLPGTVDEHPNWRRRLDTPAAEVLDAPAAGPRLTALRERRR